MLFKGQDEVMRSDRYASETDKDNTPDGITASQETVKAEEQFEASSEKPVEQNTVAETQPAAGEKKSGGKRAKRKKGKEVKLTKDSEPVDLSKLKKKELLEIMLRQGEEIDKLRDQVAALQKQLDDRTIKQRQMGTMAEAALELTNIFEEADKAVKIYLDNIRRRINGE